MTFPVLFKINVLTDFLEMYGNTVKLNPAKKNLVFKELVCCWFQNRGYKLNDSVEGP